jgi:hypothetical protein
MTDLILAIAKRNQEGFTISLPTLNTVKDGIVAAYEATQDSFSKDDLENVIAHAMQHEKIIGGWYDVELAQFQFDSCKVFNNLQEAIEFGRANKQRAIYDLDNVKEIRL